MNFVGKQSIGRRAAEMIKDGETVFLDASTSSLHLARNIKEKKGITVIMITHYMDEAARADRVVVLDDGALVFDGSPSIVFERERELIARGLDVPQCTSLVHKLRAAGMKLEGDCLTVEQCAELIARELGGK